MYSSLYVGNCGGYHTRTFASHHISMYLININYYIQKLYKEIPFFAKFSAQWNVTNHLTKLRAEGRVDQTWPDQWVLRTDDDNRYTGIMPNDRKE